MGSEKEVCCIVINNCKLIRVREWAVNFHLQRTTLLYRHVIMVPQSAICICFHFSLLKAFSRTRTSVLLVLTTAILLCLNIIKVRLVIGCTFTFPMFMLFLMQLPQLSQKDGAEGCVSYEYQ